MVKQADAKVVSGLKNFKAIQDSGVVKFTPLTVLIGDNGSGKSSLMSRDCRPTSALSADGLDEAMQMWRGFEYVINPPLDIRQISQSR